MGTTNNMGTTEHNIEQQSPAASDGASNLITVLITVLIRICNGIDAIQRQLTGSGKEFFTVAELADLVGRSSDTVRRWVSEGRIRATRVNGTGPRADF